MGIEHTRRMHDIKRGVADRLPKQWAKKWEDHTRENVLEKHGYTYLSDLVSFGTDPEYPNEVQLHIHENLTKTPIESNRMMLEGLTLLANRLKTDPELAHINTISGYSWIVYNSPDILRMLGFTVSGFNHKQKKALATMDRAVFLSQFGK